MPVVEPPLLGRTRSPVGWVVGFVQAPAVDVLEADLGWRRGLGQRLEVSPPTQFPACLSLLEPLEAPWTTELVIDCGRWTAYLNNDKNGGDPSAAAGELARQLGTRCVIAMHSPPHGPGHASTQMWVHGPEGEPPLMYERTLAATCQDGRWSWYESGRPLPFEDVARYGARRIRERFDRGLLVAHLHELGIEVDDPTWFGPGVRVRQVVSWQTRPESVQEALERLEVGGR